LKLLIAAAIVVPATLAGTDTSLGGRVAHANDEGLPRTMLITDQFNNRVIEVNQQKQIVWSFGSGNPSLCNPGPGAIIGTNDAERIADGMTLISGTGIPAGVSSFMPNGCVDNRVIVVNDDGKIVWKYGQAGVTGSGPNELNVPVFAIETPDHDILITDQGNNRIIRVDVRSKGIEWRYPTASTPSQYTLNNPNSAELLPNGHILIADENNSRVLEVDANGKFVSQFKGDASTGPLNIVAFASRLPNGHTLITDSGNNRVIEIDHSGNLVWQYVTNLESGSNTNPNPTNAVRLRNGDTAIADQFNDRALIVDHDKSTDFQYGMLNVIGNGPNQLDGPYTGFVVGDYTGQTPPPEEFSE
jgi:outer membrane protein assembly factor BamB